MIIEIWTWKFSGQNKDTFTFWKSIYADYIPKPNEEFIYTTKTGRQYHFRINHVEHEYKNGSLRAQICVRKKGK